MKPQTHPRSTRVRSTLIGMGMSIGLLLAGAGPSAQASDSFSNGLPIYHPDPAVVANINTAVCTAEPGELSHNNQAELTAFHSYWITFRVAKTGYISLDTAGSNFDTVLAVYTGTKVNALTKVAGDDDSGGNDTSKVTFLAKAGTVYHVAIDGWDASETGLAKFNVTGFVPLQAKTWTDVIATSTTEGSGIITVTTTTTGAVSGVLKQGKRSHPFTTAMDAEGHIRAFILRTSTPGQPPAELFVTQNAAGLALAGVLYADTEDLNENAQPFELDMRSASAYTAASPCPRKGIYTFALNAPAGIRHSFGTITVSATGAMTVAGFLGDGTSFTLAGPELNSGVATSGILCARTLRPTGHVTARLIIDAATNPATVKTGYFAGRRALKPGAVFLPQGAAVSSFDETIGALYVPPPPNTRLNGAFDATNGKGTLNASCSSGNILQIVNLSTANKFSYNAPNTPKVSLTVNKANGQISGTAIIGGKSCTLKGVSWGAAGFRGFTQGLTSNDELRIEPTP